VGRRPLVLAALVTAALWSPQAAGHPGHGPGEVAIGGNEFSPAKLKVAAGDTVIWFWNGPDTQHSVTSEPGQDERFDSDPGEPAPLVRHRAGDAYSHEFDRVGSYRYFCKVHASMRGTVEVSKAPARDVTRPRITDLRVTPARASRTARARFTISEAGFVVVSVRRKGASKVVKSANAFVRRGKRRIGFSVRRLRPGSYRARVVAEDNAANKSRARRARFRVVRT
jgi:plastocyanin